MQKKVLKHEARDYYDELKRRREREISWDELFEKELKQLTIMDEYFKDLYSFNVLGYDISVSDERISEALNALPTDRRDIILLTTARKHLCQFSPLTWQQMDGLNTALPYGLRKINAIRTLTTESTAVFIPFRAQEIALAIELFTSGSLNTFAKPTNVDVTSRLVCYDILDLGKQLLPIGMLVVLDSILNRITQNRAKGKNTFIIIDEIYLLFQHEYSANFLFTLWKRVRKYGAFCTGITQNVDDLLQSHTARTMLANSEFIVILNQASTDRIELAKLLNISDLQLSYITNVDAGNGLIKVGSSLVPFTDQFPRNIWIDILSVFAVKTALTDDGMDVVTIDQTRVDLIREVFWDMTEIDHWIETVAHTDSDGGTWYERVLHIIITQRTAGEQAEIYRFNDDQREVLEDLLSGDYDRYFIALITGLRHLGDGTEVVAEGVYIWPSAASDYVTSFFGTRLHPILGIYKNHTGIDIGAGYGTAILAAANGVVTTAAYDAGGYGNYIIIDHGNGNMTLYAHMSQMSAGVGQTVTQGQTIGLVGSTGMSTGPHLHFEVYVGGTRVAPLVVFLQLYGGMVGAG